MLKKILPLVFLAALVAWGVYDYVQKEGGSQTEESEQESANSTDSATDQTGEKRQTGIEQGDIAPDFTLSSLQGEKKKLSDFRGKKVIVNFWATWCGPCEAEMPEMQSYYQKHKDEDFVVLGVNMTDTEKAKSDVQPFVDKYNVTFPIVLDQEGDVMSTYQVTGFPTSYFINKKGVIEYKLVGAMNKDMMQKVIGKMEG